jgi:hypothetical protein
MSAHDGVEYAEGQNEAEIHGNTAKQGQWNQKYFIETEKIELKNPRA